MGEVQGVLYHLDWYPGLTLGGEEAVTVVGEVYRITPELEAVLDRIEQASCRARDSEYFKREVAGQGGRRGDRLPGLRDQPGPRRGPRSDRPRRLDPVSHSVKAFRIVKSRDGAPPQNFSIRERTFRIAKRCAQVIDLHTENI